MIPRGEELAAVLEERTRLFFRFHFPLLAMVCDKIKSSVERRVSLCLIAGADGDVSYLREFVGAEPVSRLQLVVDQLYAEEAACSGSKPRQKHEPQVE